MKTYHTVISPRRALATAVGALALTGGVTLLAPQAARAQAPDATTAVGSKKVSLNLQNTAITTALRALFRSAGNINYSIDPDVTGFVQNVNLNDVTFDTALNTLLNQNQPPLTKDVQNGVYHIKVKQNTYANNGFGNNGFPGTANPVTPAAPAEPVNTYRIPIDHYDAGYIAELLGRPFAVVGPNYVMGGGQQGGGFGGGGMGGGMMGGGMGGFGGGMGGGMMGGGMGGFGGGGYGGGGRRGF